MKEPTKLKRAVIKEEFIAITEDMLEAVILNQFIYWSERVNDFDKFVSEENERQYKYAETPEIQQPLHGWIYKKVPELMEEIMSTDSEKTISRRINNLIDKGFLDRRNNPTIRYDRTYQYRVNLPNIIVALMEQGYTLEGYKIDVNMYLEALKTAKRQIDDSKRHGDGCIGQNDVLIGQNDVSKRHGDGAIPEITTDITPKTTNNNIGQINYNNSSKQDNIPYQEIVEHLNLKANTAYKYTSEKTKGFIKARFNDGFTLDNFKTVIDKKCSEWKGTDMEKFLRPETLFGTKFESYLNQQVKIIGINKKQGSFTNIDQSEYNLRNNIGDIEKQLLGYK